MESRFASVDGVRLHYLEAGVGAPVLFLHGVPTHAGIWREVLPRVAPHARAVALDLAGFGASDKPLDLAYDLPTQARLLEGFCAALELRGLTVVGLDLGLLVALQAAREARIDLRGLVLMEGLIRPVADALRALPLGARLALASLRSRWLAERALVKDGEATLRRTLAAGTVRPLSPDEEAAYVEPWRDPAVRRRVWLEGVGPHTLSPRSRAPGDLADLVFRNASWLTAALVPKLVLHGDPGALLPRAAAVEFGAKIGATVRGVGRGKHLLPLDQPEAIAREVTAFLRVLDDGRTRAGAAVAPSHES